ncbi:hypothetical protein [Pseudonocardia sp. GCM10023141]|uniref:hypothetical protein n=1 Tax=Pseudonocardia sp. GCM10023141 TaxID=3252653 RepID=UPI0036D3FE3C
MAVVVLTATAACGQAESPELTAMPIRPAPDPTTSGTAATIPAPTTSDATPPTVAAPTQNAGPKPSTSAAAAPRPSVTRAAGPAPAPDLPAGRSWSASITFYGAGDNDPPGSLAIAHPIAGHAEAGGAGTYADPISMASDVREVAVGTIVYYPPLQKYFVMVDDCASCIEEWNDSRHPHLDLWAGDFSGSDFVACEHALTPDGPVTVELDPPAGRPVDTRPLYGDGGCLR